MHMPSLDHEWTVDEVHSFPDDGNRYEVIDGALYVTPAPSLRHQEAVVEMHRLLREYLLRERVGHAFVAPADIIFSPRRAVQPDVFVLPLVDGRRPERFDEVRRLLLAIEVLSPSTARADRVAKRRLYAEENVAEYWIVDLDARVVERTTRVDARPEVLSETLTWTPAGAGESLVIDLDEYFGTVLGQAT